jgi:hypothetical protein
MSVAIDNGFDVLVDRIAPDTWYAELAKFSDASLYQVWNSGSDVSRMLIRREGHVVAAAEVRLLSLPVIRGGIAYVFWGPVWKRKWLAPDSSVFRQAVRALRREYVEKRGMILWINPRLWIEADHDCLEILRLEGLERSASHATKRSLIVDLSPSLDDLRKDLDKKWRNCLSKAERSGLTIDCGTDVRLFDEFVPLHDQMLARKKLAPESDIQKYRKAHLALPPAFELQTVLARSNGAVCAGAIYSAAGDSAVYLFGATGEDGMRTSASYLVHWTIIQQLKARGVRYYDLNGINPETNPGTYHFKRGLAGKSTQEVTFFGQFQAFAPSPANQCLMLLGRLRQAARKRK